MVQLGRGFIFLESLLNPGKIMLEGFKKMEYSAEKVQHNEFIKVVNVLRKILIDKLPKMSKNETEMFKDSGITLANNEIKDIIKTVISLQNRNFIKKGQLKKITCQKGGFLNFLRPLMTTGLPLMKSVLKPAAKNVLVPLGLTAAAPSTD